MRTRDRGFIFLTENEYVCHTKYFQEFNKSARRQQYGCRKAALGQKHSQPSSKGYSVRVINFIASAAEGGERGKEVEGM